MEYAGILEGKEPAPILRTFSPDPSKLLFPRFPRLGNLPIETVQRIA